VPFWWAYAAGHAALIALICWFVRFHDQRRTRATRLIRYWYPLVLLPIIFTELGGLVKYVNPVRCHEWLIEIDRITFSGDPTVMCEQITHPALTELLQICYVSYYLFPPAICYLLWRSGKYAEFRTAMAVILAAYFTSYIGYFLVPAKAPTFYITNSFELKGLFFTPFIRPIIDYLEPIKLDCFPSGHTEVAFVVMVLAAMYAKRAFWIFLPLGTGLIFSTVYLRYHYAIDVIAGLALGIIILLVIPPITQWTEKRKGRLWEK
jgi:membrane-associated phospholipid phosphatase